MKKIPKGYRSKNLIDKRDDPVARRVEKAFKEKKGLAAIRELTRLSRTGLKIEELHSKIPFGKRRSNVETDRNLENMDVGRVASKKRYELLKGDR